MNPNLEDLMTLARRAGEILRASFNPLPGSGQPLEVAHKGVIDLVTDVDRRSEEFLLGEIRQRFPGHKIVAEESGISIGQNGAVWYIDPLDGTVNFAHGVPIFSVSIAFVRDGLLTLGVVYDPLRDECFSAERGQGAWLNGTPIRATTTNSLDESLLVTGFAYDIRTAQHTNLEQFARFTLRTQGVRRLGSAAMDLCYVGAGRLDGYWELSLQPWDVAAGALIASEAGARVTDIHGGKHILRPPLSILAANPQLHDQMLVLLGDAA